MSASYLGVEIIVSCDLLGICQFDEIITQSCSCTFHDLTGLAAKQALVLTHVEED